MVRNATDNDRAALGRIYCYSWKEGYSGILPQDYLDSLTEEKCTPHKVSSTNMFVCERNGVIAGLVNVGSARIDEYRSIGELRAIYVLPEYWRQGVGRELFTSAMTALRSMGFSQFYLWVLYDNERARSFYEHMKMRCSGELRDDQIGGSNITEIQYIGEL